MQRQMNLQGQKAKQLDLFSRHRLRPANSNDVFSDRGASVRPLLPSLSELAGLQVNGPANPHQKVVARGLTLADAIARSGPLDGYARQE